MSGGLVLTKCHHCKQLTASRVMPGGKKLLKSEGGDRHSIVEVMSTFCVKCGYAKPEKYLAQDTQHLLIPLREEKTVLGVKNAHNQTTGVQREGQGN